MAEQFVASSSFDSPALSWRAIAAGAIAIASLTLVLVTIGSALGFFSVSPWPNASVSARTFRIGTGLYLVVTALLSSTVGGYLSGRLRTKWTGVHNYEVQFRDTAHGFLAWATAAIVGTAVLAGAATFLAGGVATGAAQGAAAGATQNAGASSDYYVAELLRPTVAATTNSVAPAAADNNNAAPAAPDNNAATAAPVTAPASSGGGGANPNQQARVILTHGLAGEFSNSDRIYLTQLVAAQTGVNQADASKRVDDVVAQAKQEADQARKTAAAVSIWLAISMLVGAFAASLAAIEGGQLRDRRWRGVFGTRAYNEARIEA